MPCRQAMVLPHPCVFRSHQHSPSTAVCQRVLTPCWHKGQGMLTHVPVKTHMAQKTLRTHSRLASGKAVSWSRQLSFPPSPQFSPTVFADGSHAPKSTLNSFAYSFPGCLCPSPAQLSAAERTLSLGKASIPFLSTVMLKACGSHLLL